MEWITKPLDSCFGLMGVMEYIAASAAMLLLLFIPASFIARLVVAAFDPRVRVRLVARPLLHIAWLVAAALSVLALMQLPRAKTKSREWRDRPPPPPSLTSAFGRPDLHDDKHSPLISTLSALCASANPCFARTHKPLSGAFPPRTACPAIAVRSAASVIA